MSDAPGGRPTIAELPVLAGSSTLGDRLYDVLEEAIITGALPAGQRVHADEIAKHFGISRIPVRETLRALDAAGWIELRPRHGAYVRQRTPEELESLFEVRLLLEGEAAARAAERCTPAQIAALERLVASGEAAAEQEDADELARLNTQFHGIISAAADNEVLRGILDGLAKRVRFYFATVAPNRGRASVAEHAELVEALRRQDGARAAAIAREHVEHTRTALGELLSAAKG
jgi:DNA-binding GntR family transcriptional regulator